ncbi:MAG: hypothetical protein WCG63_06390 [Opitutaceae bacterium]
MRRSPVIPTARLTLIKAAVGISASPRNLGVSTRIYRAASTLRSSIMPIVTARVSNGLILRPVYQVNLNRLRPSSDVRGGR